MALPSDDELLTSGGRLAVEVRRLGEGPLAVRLGQLERVEHPALPRQEVQAVAEARRYTVDEVQGLRGRLWRERFEVRDPGAGGGGGVQVGAHRLDAAGGDR